METITLGLGIVIGLVIGLMLNLTAIKEKLQ